MNGVAREYWREVFDIRADVAQFAKRPRRRRREVKIRERQKVARSH
jgi:hypothetical protein